MPGPGGLLPGGVPGPGGSAWSGGAGLGGYLVEIPPIAAAAGGMHPTIKHSCFLLFSWSFFPKPGKMIGWRTPTGVGASPSLWKILDPPLA